MFTRKPYLNNIKLAVKKFCLLKRSISIILIATMLTLSAPAAPETVAGSFRGWQNVVLAYATADNFFGFTHQLFSKNPKQETQEDRDADVVRLSVDIPKSIAVGTQLQLSAIPYDTNDVPVSGVKLDWIVEKPNGETQSDLTGLVTLDILGEYKVTVRGAGKESVSTVNVTEIEKTPTNNSNQANLVIYEDWNEDNIQFAQNPRNQRGDSPGKPKENSNFNITAPILSVAGRAGLDLNLNMTYNSRVWTRMGGDISYDMDKDWPAPGWSLGFGKILNLIDGGIVLVEANGTKRFFAGSVRTESNRKYFQGQTTDGSFIKASATGEGTVINGQPCFSYGSANLSFPDGTTISYERVGSVDCSPTITNMPYRISDRHGNYIEIVYHHGLTGGYELWGKPDYIKDTLGRVYTFNYTQTNGKYYLTSITGPGLRDQNGQVTTRTFARFSYKDHTLTYNFSALNPKVRDNNHSIKVLSSIYYPATNTGYWFGDADSYSPYGMIRKVEEHKGMSFDASTGNIMPGQVTDVTRRRIYSYPENTTTAIDDVPEYTTVTETWDGMANPSLPAVTTYQVDWNSNPRTTTVMLPYNAGKTTEYSFNYTSLPDTNPEKVKDGVTFRTEFYDGNNVLRSKDEVTWDMGTLSFQAFIYQPVTYTMSVLRPSTATHTEIVNGLPLTKKSVYDSYGPYNRVLEMHEVGYNNETLRKTITQYIDKNDGLTNPTFDPRVINLPTIVEVFDGDNNRIDYTEYLYDTAPIYYASRSSAIPQNINHYTACPSCPETFQRNRGNLSNIIKYSKVTNSSLEGVQMDGRIYDSVGNMIRYKPVSTLDINQSYLTFTSATAFAYPVTAAHGNTSVPNGSVPTTTTYDYDTGLPLTVTDANQQTVSFEYDLPTWRLKKTISPTGAYSTKNYDDLNRVDTQSSFTVSGQIIGKQITRMNGLGQPFRQEQLSGTDGQGADIYTVVETEYDERGRAKKTSNPFKSNENTHGVYWSEVFYDSIGRAERTRSADGSEKFNYYDETTRPSVATNGLGHTFRIKDPIGREKWYRTDSDGNVVEVVEPNPNGDGSVATGGFLTRYTFDRLGQLTRTEQGEQGEQVRKFRYDSLGRLTHQKMAETDATLDDNGLPVGTQTGQWSDFFTYDEMSNISSSTDARGVKTIHSYQNPAIPSMSIDPLNRLFLVSYDTNGATDVLPSPTSKFEYKPTGNVSQIQSIYTENIVNGNTQRVVTNDLLYDGFGRAIEKKTTLANRPDYPLTVNYAYDSLSRITDVTYPKQYGMTEPGTGNPPQKVIHNDFDPVGRLNRLKVNNVDYASDFVFNNFEQVTSVKIGPSGANQINEQYSYDPQSGNLTNQKVLRGGTALFDLSYQYQNCSCSTGGSGQITAISNNLDRNKDRVFEYDKLGRLKKVTGGINQTWSQAYSYDRYGNRLSVEALGVEALRFEDQAVNNKSESNKIIGEIVPDKAKLTKDKLLKNVENIIDIENTNSEPQTKPVDLDLYKQTEEDSQNSINTTPGTPFDFDGDGKADYSTWRRTTGNIPAGTWSIKNSLNGQVTSSQLGENGNQIAPADYDGDGKTDQAVWNPTNGIWTIKKSSNGSVLTQQWGQKGDAIVPEDFDGDDKADLAVWRPSTGAWWILKSSDNSFYSLQWGGQQWGDIPIVGDYDGDSRADIAVWRPTGGVWYVYVLASSGSQVLVFQWGMAGDVPVASDYDGDNKTDLTVWRPSTGMWYIFSSLNGQIQYVPFGGLQFGDIPVSADYDGDGKDDIAVWRPSTGMWYLIQSSNGQVVTHQFGTSSDISVPSAYRRKSSAPNNQNKEIPRDGHQTLAYEAASNRIVTAGFEYDSAGNQTRALQKDGTLLRFQYDAAGRMVKVKSDSGTTLVTYTYGIGRERLITQEGNESSTNLTYYAWEGEAVISEYAEGSNSSLSWTKNYIYMSGALLATQTRNGNSETVQFDHPDQLGTRIITDPGTGTHFEQNTLPFGTALDSETTGSINQRFTSYDRSQTTGLDYAVNRFYDSAQGRFTTVDPIKMAATSPLNPQSLNLYAYTENDPVNKTDPSGLTPGFPTFSSYSGGYYNPFGGGTGYSIPSWLSSFLNGIFGSLFGGGNTIRPGQLAGPNQYTVNALVFNTSVTHPVTPPFADAGTTKNVESRNGLGYQKNGSTFFDDCLNKAFLDTLAWAEGSTYDTVVRGKVISSPNFPNLVGKRNVRVPTETIYNNHGIKGYNLTSWPTDHPNILVFVGIFNGKKTNSTAAGRYQILKGTWDDFGFKGMTFSPKNQDAYAIKQLNVLGVPPLLETNNLNAAIAKANRTWASLPGSPYGQNPKSLSDFTHTYNGYAQGCKK